MDDTKKALLSIDIDTATLTQNVNGAKAAVADLSAQLKELKASGKDSGEAFDKLSEQLKKAGEEAKKSNDALKEHTRGLSDSTAAAEKLKKGVIDLSKEHSGAAEETGKYSKTLKEYGKELFNAAEKASPFVKSIGDTSKGFKAFREITGQVGDAFTAYKNKVSATLENSKTFNSTAGAGAKAFEVLKTGTEVATGGVEGFTKALASTGIGLIIIAVAALIDYLKTFKPVVDLVEKVMAGFNGAIAAGKHILEEFFGSIKSVGDLFSKLGNFIAHPIDSLRNLGNAMADAAVKTYKLQEAQQKLNEKLQEDTVKAAQNAAEIARLRTEAQTAGLARQKEIAAQIKKIQNDQTKEERDHAEEQIRINVNKVLATNGARALEKKDIEDLDLEKIKSLATSKHINAEDIKSLEDAVKQMADLRKQESEKLFKANEEKHAAIKTAQQKHNQEMDAIQASRDRMKIAAQHDELQKELAEIEINFAQQQKQYKGQTAVLAQLAKERDQQIADVKQRFKEQAEQQELRDQKELFDLKQEAAIKAAKDLDDIHDLQTEQNDKDLEFELKNTQLTATQKLIIQEKYAQKQAELDKKYIEDQKKNSQKNADTETKTVQQQADAENKINRNKLSNYQNYFSKLAGLFAKNTEVGKAAFMAKKAFAVAELAISTEQQVSDSISATKGFIKEDSHQPFPLNIALVAKDIAFGIADVASTIANGVKQAANINSISIQGFARGGMYLSDGYGGYITGPGTGTSDSINAKLSNGEAIINARSTEMFAPILSAINIAGGGRAFGTTMQGNGYALGGLFNGSNTLNYGSNELAAARATNDIVKTLAANMPRQVLVVEDIQASLQNKVMLQNMSNF